MSTHLSSFVCLAWINQSFDCKVAFSFDVTFTFSDLSPVCSSFLHATHILFCQNHEDAIHSISLKTFDVLESFKELHLTSSCDAMLDHLFLRFRLSITLFSLSLSLSLSIYIYIYINCSKRNVYFYYIKRNIHLTKLLTSIFVTSIKEKKKKDSSYS